MRLLLARASDMCQLVGEEYFSCLRAGLLLVYAEI